MKKKPRFLINTLKPIDVEKGFTLVLCFSRLWCVDPFFERFKKLKFNRAKCHLLIFDNTDNVLLEQALMSIAKELSDQFLSLRYYKTYRKGGFVLRGELNNNFYKSKIYPISQMQYDIISLITTDVFVQLEDDELPTNPNTITRLLNLLKKDKVGMATGVSSARNPDKLPVGMGVHSLVERDGDRIVKRICCSPYLKGVHEVQATGFYCFATYSTLWKEVLNDSLSVASGLPHWAFDTWTTNQLFRKGYKILADFSLWCDHIQTIGNEIYYFNQKDAKLDCYVYIPELNVYAYWQNSPTYGWVVQDGPTRTRKNKRRASTEVLQR